MAADPSLLSTIGGILKDRYEGSVIDAVRRGQPLEELLEKDSKSVDGDKVKLSLRTGGNQGIGFRSDGSALPSAGRQKYATPYLEMTNIYGRLQLSGRTIAATKTNAGAFARALDDSMKYLVKDIRLEKNSFNFGDGSGALARVASKTGNVITVDRWNRLFKVGRVLDSYTLKSGGTQHLDSTAITAINRAQNTVTVSAIGSTEVDDYLFIEDTRGVCQMGLLGIVDDGTYLSTFQGLARASYDVWNSKVLKSAGAPRNLTEALLLQAFSSLEEDGIPVSFAIGTIWQRNDLINDLQLQKRFVNPGKKLKGVIRAVELDGGFDFVADSDCPAGYCFGGDMSVLKFYQQNEGGWMDDDGLILKPVSGYDAVEAIWRHYRELGCHDCGALFRIEDLNENRPSGV